MESLYIIGAFCLGFFIAQMLKLLATLIWNKGKISFGDFMHAITRSGGMPSGHAASFTGATYAIGGIEGFDTAVFALAVCMTVIIIYDAVNVRFAVGQQGRLLNKMVENHGHKNHNETPLKLVEGHTIPQVIIGILIGLLTGSFMVLMFYY